MAVNVFHFWLHVSTVSIDSGREYHGESHYITRMSNPYNAYSLSRFWEDWLSHSTLKFLENSYLPVFQHDHANLLQEYYQFIRYAPKLTCKFTLHLHMIQFKHVWGPTILLGLPVCCCHGNPCTLSNSFVCVCHILGLLLSK